ncbi:MULTISPECIES: asparaginase domain-containing protein [unclassified Roseivivax]|uniref:asparaginase domain-containing protein n=1 Tax=Roseivivax sp. GX 12232 TaxID=2900547 RepID=UPI001E4A7BE3|nr:asparaginase [Roseivivax sp. GX 12232]
MSGAPEARALRVLVTGGTIDKVHDPRTEGLGFSPDGATHLPEMLRIGRCHFAEVEKVLLKDSLYFDAADRAAIAEAVLRAPEPALVVTHGTGTMGETARDLAPQIEGTGKTVVLTGAMRPFSLYASDGEFNLGGAVVAAQILGPGVWGVMNGRVFPAERLDKNVEQGRFDL